MKSDYLYHYTSIHTLALILKNRKLRFNNLLNVDDPEEAESEDLELIGRHCLISCWTDNSEDVLPMWNMYTPDMKGVRIGMRKYPFKKYIYNKGEMHFTENVESYINFQSNYVKKVSIAPNCPLLVKVEYTEDESLLRPKIRRQTDKTINISYAEIGHYKRTCWTFQKEYRYIITTAPWSMEEIENMKASKESIDIINRVDDEKDNHFCSEIFLDLSDEAFDDMEILLAPKTSDSEYIIVQALLDKYCQNANIKIEKSRIRVR